MPSAVSPSIYYGASDRPRSVASLAEGLWIQHRKRMGQNAELVSGPTLSFCFGKSFY